MHVVEISLFPLYTVLFPGGPLPLRIFETRYLDMLSRCLKDGEPFGVVLIREGSEVGPAQTCQLGTTAKVVDWYQGSDGLLGVTACGQKKFRIASMETRPDGLRVASAEILPDEEPTGLPPRHEVFAHILRNVLDDLGSLYSNMQRSYDDAAWVGYRLAEILPITLQQKQSCLEFDDPVQRLDMLAPLLESVREDTGV